MKQQYEAVLAKYIPLSTVERIAELIIFFGVHLRITRERSTKLGDFTPAEGVRGHKITVNHNLNPYAFLITLVHELAHFVNWNRHGDSVKPHGTEWKQHFKELMEPFLNEEVFPEAVLHTVRKYLRNPAASSCVDEDLLRALRAYDTDPTLLLEDLPENALFKLKTGRVFRKGEQRRKYFTCMELESRKQYLVNPLAEVELLGERG